jgi:cytochrome c oxidase cbb3-type subunit I/II
VEVFESAEPAPARLGLAGTVFSPPFIFTVLGTLFACAWMFGNSFLRLAGLFGTGLCVLLAWAHFESGKRQWGEWYDRLLVSALPFTALTFLAVVAGGLIQILPTIAINTAQNVEDRRQIPYTPLELAGRDLYIREGCYLCHSQMIRTLVPDVLRYGDYSRLGESIYDHPFQWGSKRNGPDLAREAGKYPDIWHFRHFENPRSLSVGSIMPNYPWLYTQSTDVAALPSKIAVQRLLGVPYPNWTAAEIQAGVEAQEQTIVKGLRAEGALTAPDREVVALIAYIQTLGKSEKLAPKPDANPDNDG